ncbi:MAG: hypothetical protein AAFY02_16290 [Pseudomonadota bacterium]
MSGDAYEDLIQSRFSLFCSKAHRTLSILFLLFATIAILSLSGAVERDHRIERLNNQTALLQATIHSARTALESLRSLRSQDGDINCAAAVDTVRTILALENRILPNIRQKVLRSAELSITTKKETLEKIRLYFSQIKIENLKGLNINGSHFEPSEGCENLKLRNLLYLGWVSGGQAKALKRELELLAARGEEVDESTAAQIQSLVGSIRIADRTLFTVLLRDLDERAIRQADSWDTRLADLSLRQVLDRMYALQEERTELLGRKAGFVEISLPGVPGTLALREVILLAPLALIVGFFLSWRDVGEAARLKNLLPDKSRYPMLGLFLEARSAGLFVGDWLMLFTVFLALSVVVVQWESIPRTLEGPYIGGLLVAALVAYVRHRKYAELKQSLCFDGIDAA